MQGIVNTGTIYGVAGKDVFGAGGACGILISFFGFIGGVDCRIDGGSGNDTVTGEGGREGIISKGTIDSGADHGTIIGKGDALQGILNAGAIIAGSVRDIIQGEITAGSGLINEIPAFEPASHLGEAGDRNDMIAGIEFFGIEAYVQAVFKAGVGNDSVRGIGEAVGICGNGYHRCWRWE